MTKEIGLVTFRDIYTGLKQFNIPPSSPIIVHTSLSAFGEVQGGAETLLGAIMAAFPAIIMPTFTYKTMVIPEMGPDENGITYGAGKDLNLLAEIYSPDMPADRLMGMAAELLRSRPNVFRSNHPILSFSGINTSEILLQQSLEDPLGIIGKLAAQNGWAILAGVDHTVNISIHYAEKSIHRPQFIRWALTKNGAVQCPSFPGCSDGFQQGTGLLDSITCKVKVGDAIIQALPLQRMIEKLAGFMVRNPLALLCERKDCERCNTVRRLVEK